ncbi:unnamed protein product, partial [Medioppia subpectinata]
MLKCELWHRNSCENQLGMLDNTYSDKLTLHYPVLLNYLCLTYGQSCCENLVLFGGLTVAESLQMAKIEGIYLTIIINMYYKPIARLLILLTPLFITPEAYSHGAPTKSCQTLYPGHGVDKQYGQAPYEIRASLGSNGNVLVTIESKGLPFTGFMLQGRQATDRESLVNGRFSEDKNTQARNCNGDNP